MMESSNSAQYLPQEVIQAPYLPHKMDDDYVIESEDYEVVLLERMRTESVQDQIIPVKLECYQL